jgi:hypothetical protein
MNRVSRRTPEAMRGRRPSVRLAAALACLAWLTLGAGAGRCEPAITILNNGDPANRIDLVILGDGYTAAEMPRYAQDAARVVSGCFAQEPFRAYRLLFNVHRVDVISPESGANHPERRPPVVRNTALDAAYNCAGIQRLICVNLSKVNGVLQRSLRPGQRDLVLVLVNDPEYGGSGGQIGVASMHPDAIELALHEMGHTIGLLADEYGGNSGPACNASVEPREVNITRETRRDLLKWQHWLTSVAPIPSMDARPGAPGLYEGGRYCDRALYRPTFNSKMRSLDRPFEQINSEQLVKRFYNWVSPLDASEPAASALSLLIGQTQTFRVATPLPLPVQWLVDGQARGTGLEFVLAAMLLVPGVHTVEAVIQDTTPMVRSDPARVLTERRKWSVTITGP